jgi:hypothetical protein
MYLREPYVFYDNSITYQKKKKKLTQVLTLIGLCSELLKCPTLLRFPLPKHFISHSVLSSLKISVEGE